MHGRTDRRPRSGGRDHRRHRRGHVPGRVHATHRRLPDPVDRQRTPEPVVTHDEVGGLQADPGEEVHPRLDRARGGEGVEGHELAGPEGHAGQSVALGLHRRDRLAHDLDPAGAETCQSGVVDERLIGDERDHVIAQCAEHEGVVGTVRGRHEHADAPIANLPPVAERAVHDPAPPLLREPRDLRQDVDGAGGDDQPACRHDHARVERDREADGVGPVPVRGGRRHDPPGRHLDVVCGDLLATDATELRG